MKKKLLSMSLAAAMAVSLAACGGGEGSSVSKETAAASVTETTAAEVKPAETSAAAEQSAPAAGETTIEVWTNDRHDIEYMESMIDKFNLENKDGITINLTVITEDYANMIKLAYDGGTAPDIITVNNGNLALSTFVDAGILVPLNDYIDADETYQKVNEPYEHAYEGANAIGDNLYYVFSGMRSGVRVQYNKDLLAAAGYDEVPGTLDQFIKMAADITEQGKGEYYGIGFTSSSPFGRLLEPVAQTAGIHYYDYVNGRFDFSGYAEVLEKFHQFITDESAYPDQQGVDNMRALFAQGEFALWSNASQEAGVFTSQIPIEDFEWGVAEVPMLYGEAKGALDTMLQKGYAIISSCENQDQAWKAIQYFQSEEFLKGYLDKGYNLAITPYMDSKVDKSKIGRLADFSLLDYESVYPTVPTVNLTGDNYKVVLWNAVMGYVGIDEAIEDLNTRYNQALDADVANGTVKRLVIPDFDPLHPGKGTAAYLDK